MSEALIKAKPVSLADDTDWKAQQEVPEEDTNRAFRELGIETITVKKIRSYRKIADALKKVGMVEYERGRLMHREVVLEAARMALIELIVQPGSAETKIGAANILNTIISSENKTAELNIRLEELAKMNQQEKRLVNDLPPPGMNVGLAVEVNVEKGGNTHIVMSDETIAS